MKLPISVMIMTQNEEMNIQTAIESTIENFDQVVVTDSFSTDKTLEICKKFPTIQIYSHKFEGWAEQRNWMLQHCIIKNDIIFFLDADEYITTDFISELAEILSAAIPFSAIYLKLDFIFLNKHLKYAYGHPKIKRIFLKKDLQFKGEGAREYAIVAGPTITLKSPLVHHDKRDVSFWIEKHNRNSFREAELQIKQFNIQNDEFTEKLSKILKAKLWIRRNIWRKMPLVFRAFAYFFYRYVLGLGFLDGRTGFIYCFLHAFWYQILIDVKIIEKLQGKLND